MSYLECYDSILLRSVGHCRFERLKKYYSYISHILTTDEDNVRLLAELSSWKNEIYFNDNYCHISSMWEVGIFIFNCTIQIVCVLLLFVSLKFN